MYQHFKRTNEETSVGILFSSEPSGMILSGTHLLLVRQHCFVSGQF